MHSDDADRWPTPSGRAVGRCRLEHAGGNPTRPAYGSRRRRRRRRPGHEQIHRPPMPARPDPERQRVSQGLRPSSRRGVPKAFRDRAESVPSITKCSVGRQPSRVVAYPWTRCAGFSGECSHTRRGAPNAVVRGTRQVDRSGRQNRERGSSRWEQGRAVDCASYYGGKASSGSGGLGAPTTP